MYRALGCLFGKIILYLGRSILVDMEESQKTFAQKWFSLRSGVTKIKKTRTNEHFNSSYFDINDTLNGLNPLLEANRLLLKQPIRGNRIYSIIQDIDPNADGELEQEESYLDLPAGLTPQKMGSAITYYRRYTLVALLGLEAEDDDGNKASGINGAKRQHQGPRKVHQPQGNNKPAPKGPRPAAPPAPKPQKPKQWLNLSNPQTGEVTQQYWQIHTYKKENPSFTKEMLLKQYKVNKREERYLDEIFN